MFKKAIDGIHHRMLTKDDAKNFATKDDLKNFPTKEDAKNFLTKDDAKNFLTKDDAKNFLTKNDAKNFATKDDIHRIFAILMRHEQKFEDLHATLTANHQEILALFDGYAKKFTFFDNRQVFNTGRLNELEPMVRDHERRISSLEGDRAK